MRITILAIFLCPLLIAEEGLWLVNQFPKDAVKKTYGFDVTDAFLGKLQHASVRFNSGGSGSFISPNGLLFTNHHVGRDCIQKVSTAQNDYIANGFHAKSAAEEKKCPDLEVNVLESIEDVTAAVKAGETASTGLAQVNAARRNNMATIEKECVAATGLRCDVVTLYSGARYHLYRYKKYTDVRLVFAPEESIAAFGGDPDNFTYPRYCLDFAMFRAYEDGKPVSPKQYFRWSKTGAKNGELVFVSGNPGTTGRLDTLSGLEFFRDVSYPMVLDRLGSMIKTLEAFGEQNAEHKRIAGEDLLGAQNSFKAYTGFLSGLRDPQLMGRKRDEEQTLQARVKDKAEYANLWENVAKAYATYRPVYKQYALSTPQFGELFSIARNVLRLPVEKAKPNGERLREYRDSALPSLEQAIYSEAPLNADLEIAELADYFTFMHKELGPDDAVVRAILQGRAPAEAAAAYVKSSKLLDVAERKRLASDSAAAESSKDGMIELARILDPRNRELRKKFEDEVDAVLKTSAAQIALARFEADPNAYPDATFTFRISYAKVAGYTNGKGEKIPWATVYSGVYKRATGEEPFVLPKSWLDAKPRVNMGMQFNFVSTADTHGGNSGSPTVNSKGEIVGILFDGNIEGLPNRFVFTDRTARSVHVASQGIVESLRSVYKADGLLKEMFGN